MDNNWFHINNTMYYSNNVHNFEFLIHYFMIIQNQYKYYLINKNPIYMIYKYLILIFNNLYLTMLVIHKINFFLKFFN